MLSGSSVIRCFINSVPAPAHTPDKPDSGYTRTPNLNLEWHVRFTAYPGAVISATGDSVLRTLGSDALWRALSSIGIQAVHPGPTKLAGGLRDRTFTPSIDGNFDRIGLGIDPRFGTEEEFVAMSRMAAAHNAVVIDDVVPSHTGKGADFRRRRGTRCGQPDAEGRGCTQGKVLHSRTASTCDFL
jgi:trehalose synthase